MPYILYKSNGRVLATVTDGSVEKTSSDLVFVGKNYAGYGEILNQNIVKVLENFANATPPSRPLIGQLYYDTVNNKLNVYDGTRFKSLTNIDITPSTKPRDNSKGDLWWNEFEQKLYFYNGSKFVMIGPFISEFAGSALVPAVAKTDNNLQKYVLKFTLTDDYGKAVVGTVSRDEYTPNIADDLTVEGFNIVKPGITLPGANPTTGDSTAKGYYFWGTAAHALRLGNFSASEYALQSYVSSLINDDGITVYNQKGLSVDNYFRFHADAGNKEGKITGTLDTRRISFNLYYNGTTTNIISIDDNNIIPAASPKVNLGTYANRFNYFWAGTATTTVLTSTQATFVDTTTTNLRVLGQIIGSQVGNVKGNTTGTHYGDVVGAEGTVLINANDRRINATTSSFTTLITTNIKATGENVGNIGYITGNWSLVGTSRMEATYRADLAEYYEGDNTYEVGTVLIFGGEKEVTISSIPTDTRVAGVVSDNAAYSMYSACPGLKNQIALKGRVPCKVVGSVQKGDLLVTSDIEGYACSAGKIAPAGAVIGKAMQSNDDNTGLIEIRV